MSNERIFISYRRDDAGWAAHHLYQRLSDEFGKQRVFMDIDSIPFAANFREAISEQIRGSAVCLAMIGPRWLESVTQRMDDPRDFVRIELESAHELNIPVIPLLVDGAAPPANKALPPSLRQLNLHDINTLPMRSGIDLNSDIDRIVRGLHHFFDDQKKYASGKSARAVRGGRRSGNRALFAAMLVVAVTILGVAISIVNKDWKAVEQPSRWIQDGLALEGVSIVDEANYGPKMLIIPAGKFLMGAPPGNWGYRPQREVTVPSFAIGQTEVTFDEYDVFAKSTGRKLPIDHWGRGKQPVINVTWHDAQAYVQWLSEQTGASYRLPSEAEWEYVARAGTTTPFPTGSCTHTDLVNYDGRQDDENCGAQTWVFRGRSVPAGSLPESTWHVHEILGNVSEWVQDCWHSNWNGAPSDGSAWEQLGPVKAGGNCSSKVTASGDWSTTSSFLRIGMRGGGDAKIAENTIGFRVARDL